jgi:S1-C subfamily serine protease
MRFTPLAIAALNALCGVGPAAVARAFQDPADFAVVLAEEKRRIALIQQVSPAVACVFPKESTAGGGSGVIIDPEGYGLTNFHVVAPMLHDRAGDVGLPDHKKYDIEVLGLDPHGDVAMFRALSRSALPAAGLGDSDMLQVGDSCLAMGNPFMLAEDFTPTVTFGIVSGLHRYQWGVGRALSYTDCIQVDTSINPGNSGGPLFDMSGKLVGINGRISIEERSRVNVGVGYAITINQIKRFLPALRAGLTTPHASAGFTVADATRRVIVNQMLQDGGAYRAGLRLGDQVLRFGGVEIRSANHFASQVGTYPARWPIELVYQREGKMERARFRLDTLPMPEQKRGRLPPGHEKVDPFAETPVTQAANRRAVRRALRMYQSALGGTEAAARLQSIRATGVRRPVAKPQAAPQPIETAEDRASATTAVASAADVERAIRWQLVGDAGDSDRQKGRVIRSDEVHGRIGAVIERSLETGDGERTTYRVCLDDADGRLLAIEFDDPASERPVRIEYDDERRCGPLKLPHKRRWYEGENLSAEDEFEKIEVAGP